jgi:UDP-N-acetyl-D-mannosaminuronic acid dehydrogenase
VLRDSLRRWDPAPELLTAEQIRGTYHFPELILQSPWLIPHDRRYALGLLSAGLDDERSALRYARNLEVAEEPNDSIGLLADLAREIRALLALQKGDASSALSILDGASLRIASHYQVASSPLHMRPVGRLLRGEALVASGRGTTAYVTQHLAEAGCTVDVAFCPERIAEGHAIEELHSLPQIIGADDDRAAERAAELFSRLTETTIRTSSKEAELAKLFTNTWRYMKFAVANQFFMIADQAGVDYTNVLRAIRQDYPRAADLPGPGFAAGPCLFKDAMQLSAFTSDHFPMGQAAMQVNEGLPAYVVNALERRYGGLRGKTVGILGMAFKAESDDTRASLSYKLRKLLSWSGARVLATDPFVQDDRLVPLETVLSDSDILVLGAPHRAYRSLQIGGKDVVDVWGALGEGIRL